MMLLYPWRIMEVLETYPNVWWPGQLFGIGAVARAKKAAAAVLRRLW